jgi:hypothetical protein
VVVLEKLLISNAVKSTRIPNTRENETSAVPPIPIPIPLYDNDKFCWLYMLKFPVILGPIFTTCAVIELELRARTIKTRKELFHNDSPIGL